MDHTTTTLPASFKNHGFEHQLVKRTGAVAIYRRQRTKTGSTHFECVLIRKTAKSRVLPSGSTIKAGSEIYPAASDWGSSGWTFKDLNQAEVKFNELVQQS